MKKFFSTPKGLLLIILTMLVVLSGVAEGQRVLPVLVSAVSVAALLDLPFLRWKKGAWEFPDGAILTGLLVAMVLSPFERWYVGAATAAVAILAKWAFRSRFANIFNPAAFGLVVTFYVFSTAHSWWGALPQLPTAAIAVLFITRIFITDRVNKMPLVLMFLGIYYALFTVVAFAGEPGKVAEIFRAPDLHAVLFFAFFILTDPPTSPAKYGDQLICATIVAVVSFAVFELLGAVHYLLSGVLVGNVWEALRRRRAKTLLP
jgi:enediyne biosynthesis protein E5